MWTTIPAAVLYVIFTVFGIFGNLVFSISIIRYRKFGSVLHYFIFATAIADFLLLTPQPVKVLMILVSIDMTQVHCFYTIVVGITGIISVNPLYLMQGIDRLIAVWKPLYYRHLQENKIITSVVLGAFPLFYTIFLLLSAFLQKDEQKKVVICTFQAAMGGSSVKQFYDSTLIVNLLVIFLYSITWLILRNSVTRKTTKTVFTTLLLTVSLDVFSWILVCLISIFVPMFDLEPFSVTVVNLYGSLFACLASASNPVIYYTRNPEYREAMRSLFGLKTKKTAFERSVSKEKTPKRGTSNEMNKF